MVRQRLMASVFLPAALGLVACARSDPWGAEVPDDRARCTLQVAVPNMACETACPIKVHALLAKVEGVEQVDVDFEKRSATVHAVWPACGHDGYERMVESLATRGYEGQIVSAE